MAEFKEVMEQRSRMCKHYLSTDISCENCPLDKARKNTMFQCFRYIAEYYQEAENVIMEWSKEHPAPIYPTWEEWLVEQGILQFHYIGATDKRIYTMSDLGCSPIQDDIAKKLGIQPKEM